MLTSWIVQPSSVSRVARQLGVNGGCPVLLTSLSGDHTTDEFHHYARKRSISQSLFNLDESPDEVIGLVVVDQPAAAGFDR